MSEARAFAAAVVIGSTDGTQEYLYVMGGYNQANGFLDTVDRVDKDGAIAAEASLTLPVKMSHFCVVMTEPKPVRSCC